MSIVLLLLPVFSVCSGDTFYVVELLCALQGSVFLISEALGNLKM